MSDVGRGSRRAGAGLALGVMVFALVATAASGDPRDPAAQDQGARHVFVVTLDGLRGQELFSGYAAELNTEESGGVVSPDALAGRFDAPTPEGRRERLLPFLWTVVARDGQIFGDASQGSVVRVTNGFWFSYPGYSELLTGVADPRIDSNDPKTNPNVNVLEWLSHRPGFEGRVAAFASWDVFPFILATERSGRSTARGRPSPIRRTSSRSC